MTQADKWGQGEEVQASAYHEAGHAVIDMHVGLPLKSIDIRREDGDLGGCDCEAPPETVVIEAAYLLKARTEGNPVALAKITPATRQWIDKMIRSKLAGQIAEVKFRGRPLGADEMLGVIDDQEHVQRLAGVRWTDAEREQRLQEVEAEVAGVLARPAVWMAVEVYASGESRP
jgi:hypothetical protein